MSTISSSCETATSASLSSDDVEISALAKLGAAFKYLDINFPRTKPKDLDTKCGSSGSKVLLKANVFKIDDMPDFDFNQYRVDFEPDLDLANARKALVGKQMSPYGGK